MYKLLSGRSQLPPLPPMTDPLDTTAAPIDPASAGDLVEGGAPSTNVSSQLRTRVVREARRETWFVVNEGTEDLATIPIEIRPDGSLRRVDVNGEVAEFTAGETSALVRPRRPLRAGAGTIVVLNFR